MKDLIGWVATRLDHGYATKEDIRQALIEEGEMTNEQAYLTYIAGEMIHQDREKHRKETASTLPKIPVEIL